MLTPWMRTLDWWVFGLGAVYLTAFLIAPTSFSGVPLHIDPMAPSGFLLILLGSLIASWVQSRFPGRVEELFRSGSILLDDDAYQAFWTDFRKLVRMCILAVTIPLAALVTIGPFIVGSNEQGLPHLIAGGLLGSWLVGVRFGVGIATGIAASRLAHGRTVFVPSPGHPDRAAGFGRLGYFYLDQALVLLLPALFMVFWIVFVGKQIETAKPMLTDALRSPEELQTIVDVYKKYPAIWEYTSCEPKPTGPDRYFWDEETEQPFHVGYLLCPPDGLRFIWQVHYYRLLLFNLVVVLLAWLLPNLVLRGAMRRGLVQLVDPRILQTEAALYAKRGQLATDPTGGAPGEEQALAQELANLRSCPTFPVPLGTVILTFLSNVSALAGLSALNTFV